MRKVRRRLLDLAIGQFVRPASIIGRLVTNIGERLVPYRHVLRSVSGHPSGCFHLHLNSSDLFPLWIYPLGGNYDGGKYDIVQYRPPP